MRRYQQGESANALARAYNVAPSALINYLRSQQIVVRPNKRLSDKDLVLLQAEYAAGATMRELEVRHGLSHGVTVRALKGLRRPAKMKTAPETAATDGS